MKGKVLIVDDDPILVTILEEKLRLAGYETASAKDGQEALEKVGEADPEIIVSDIMMPRLDGYELHRRLRNNPETASIPFVFLSAKTEPSDQLEGLRMGADDYICKPFDFQDLTDRMEKVMRRVAKARAFNAKADFSGHVTQMSLVDVLQIAEINHKTGELVFKNDKGKKTGKAFFDKGNLVHARMGVLTGEEAFYGLMGEAEGYFEFFGKPVDVPRTVGVANMSVLLNGSRLLDEAAGLEDLVADPGMKMSLASERVDSELEGKIGREHVRKVMEMARKGATVGRLLSSKSMSRPRAASTLCRLLQAGVVAAGEPWSESAAAVEEELLREIEKARDHRRTGVLEIDGRSEKASVFFEDGRIVHAYFGEAVAKKALFRILAAKGGRFRFVESPVSVSHTVKGTTGDLVEAAVKEMKGLARLDSGFFRNRLIVNASGLQEAEGLQERKYLMRVLALAQQYDTIRDVLEASPYTDLATCKALVELIKSKVLLVGSPAARKIVLATDSSADVAPTLADSGEFLRLPFQLSVSGAVFPDTPRSLPENFFETLHSSSNSSASLAPSADDFDDLFRNLLPVSDIVAVLCWEKLADSTKNAMEAFGENRSDYSRLRRMEKSAMSDIAVEIVDGKTASAGLGLLVAEAARKLAQGFGCEQVRERLESLISRQWTFVVTRNADMFPDDFSEGKEVGGDARFLFSLHGGEVVEAEALRAGESVHERVAELFGARMEDHDAPVVAAVAHAANPDLAERVKNLLELNFAKMRIHVGEMGATFAAWGGPGAVVASFVPDGA